MNLKPSLYKIIDTSEGILLWHNDSVSFYRIEKYHSFILNQDFESSIETLEYEFQKLFPQENFNVAVEELIDLGILNKQNSTQTPKEVTPSVTDFRVVVTEACDFACPECFSTTFLKEQKIKLRSMSEKVAEEFCEQLIQLSNPTDEIGIHFFGGEPLLNFKIIRLITNSLSKAYSNKFIGKPKFSITTNAYSINEEVLDFFKIYQFDVGVSIELDEGIHNSIRRLHNNSETYTKVIENYRLLNERGIDVHPLVTAYDKYCEQLPEKVENLILLLKPGRLTINTPYKKDTLQWNIPENYHEILITCEKVAKRFNVTIDSAFTPCFSAISHGVARANAQCFLGNKVMVGVNTDGKIFRSTHHWNTKLMENSLGIFKSSNLKNNYVDECETCFAKNVCGGVNEEFQIATNLKIDSHKCNFYKNAIFSIAHNLDFFGK